MKINGNVCVCVGFKVIGSNRNMHRKYNQNIFLYIYLQTLRILMLEICRSTPNFKRNLIHKNKK